jgi:hypothetical protein
MKRELAISGLVPLALGSCGVHGGRLSDGGLFAAVGTIWFLAALVFVLSLARMAARKVGRQPGDVHDSRISAAGFGLLLFALLASVAHAAPPLALSHSTNRLLIIDASSMPVAAGQATLTIGALQRADGIYTGAYRMNVSPYFYKNEKGKLNIVVSDESLAKISTGNAAAVTGTATTSGKGGATRHIDATATPLNKDRGTLKLWFMSGDRKMTFEPNYHFADRPAPVKSPQTNINANVKRRSPVLHRAAEASRFP